MYQCQQCGCEYITSRLDFICSTKCSACFKASNSQNVFSWRYIGQFDSPKNIEVADSFIPLEFISNKSETPETVEIDVVASSPRIDIENVQAFVDVACTPEETTGMEVSEADSYIPSVEIETTGEDSDTETGEDTETDTAGGDSEHEMAGTDREELISADFKQSGSSLEYYDRSDSSSPERDSSSDSDYEPTKFMSFYEGDNRGKFKYCDSYLQEVAFEEIGLTTAGKKPYKCRHCRLTFFSKTQRKNHSVVHTEQGDILYSGVKVRILN